MNEEASWTVADVLTATGGRLCAGSSARVFAGAGIDSRSIASDELFVAIRGAVHDAHRFVPEVVEKGIRGVVVREDCVSDLPMERMRRMQTACIAVADTTRALGDLAAYHRRRLNVSVIAITGSNGKTTTRAMTEAVTSTRYAVLATRGNLNNEFGLPLTLLDLQPSHQWAVVELGMSHFGEIRRLGDICAPAVGVITNIGPAHLEGVGSIEGVAQAKAELLETIRPGGAVVLNADDPRTIALAQRSAHRVVDFGTASSAAVRGTGAFVNGSSVEFGLSIGGRSTRVRLHTTAAFLISNALAAAAAGHVLGLSLEDIRAGLERFRPADKRMMRIQLADGIVVFDDTYNANPASMAAAIRTMAGAGKSGRTILVLGDMLELGPASEALHREVGRLAAECGAHRLYVAGAFAPAVAEGARKGAMTPESIRTGSREEIADDLLQSIRPGDRILVKGSRGMRMENIVEMLRNRRPAAADNRTSG